MKTEAVKKDFCKDGRYTKFFQYKDGVNTFLSFAAKNHEDNYFKVMQMIREKEKNTNGFQVCEIKEENNNFENVFYIHYNIWGQPIQGKFLYFDFEKETVTTEEGKIYKVVNDYEYTYRIQKTQIKAIGGIKGFYNFIIECMHVDSPFNTSIFGVIEKI